MEEAETVKKEHTIQEQRVSHENVLWLLYRIWAEEDVSDERLHAVIQKC